MGFLSKLRNSLKDDLINPSFSLTKKAKGASLDIADSIISNPKRTAIIATSPIWAPTAATIGAAAAPFIAAKGAYDLSGKNKKTKLVRDHTVGYALDAMDEGSKLGVGAATASFSEPRRRPDGTLDVDWDFSAPWGKQGNIQEWEEEAKRQGYSTGGKNPIKSLANTYYTFTRIAAKAEREDKETPEGVKVALDYGLDPTMYISPGTIGKGSTKLGLASTGLGKMLLGAEGVGATSRTARIIGGLLEGSPKTALGMAAGAGAAAEITSRTPWGGDDYFGSLLGSAVGGITQGKINNSLKKPGIKSNIITDTYGDVFRDFKTTVDESGIINKGPKLATGNKWIEMLNKAGITKKELEAGDILEELSARGNEQLTRAQILEIINKYNFDVEEKIYSGDKATYGQYVVPGTDPETYREILITQKNKTFDRDETMGNWIFNNEDPGSTRWRNGNIEIVFIHSNGRYAVLRNGIFEGFSPSLLVAKQKADRLAGEPWITKNNQWPDANNVLMHLRAGDKDDGKTLFVHEIQSDWAQENRSGQEVHVEHRGSERIPHPFPDNWQTVGVKRLLRYAAENGYSRIEFARGEDTLNIDGMGLEKGSMNELGRLNSYNGSISLKETKEGQAGDYRIINEENGYTAVKFNDDVDVGTEDNTYVFFTDGKKLTENMVNEVLWDIYRNNEKSKIYDGRNLRPHKGTGLPGIAEGLAKKIGLSVEKQPRYASSYESLEHDAVISLHDLDLDEWQENVDIALNTGAITSEQAKDIKKVLARWVVAPYIGMQHDFSLYEYLGEIFKNPDKYSQEVKDANRFFEIMGWSNKNIESTPSTIINLLPEGKANLLSKPQTIFGMVGDDQGFENKLRELRQKTMSADPTEAAQAEAEIEKLLQQRSMADSSTSGGAKIPRSAKLDESTPDALRQQLKGTEELMNDVSQYRRRAHMQELYPDDYNENNIPEYELDAYNRGKRYYKENPSTEEDEVRKSINDKQSELHNELARQGSFERVALSREEDGWRISFTTKGNTRSLSPFSFKFSTPSFDSAVTFIKQAFGDDVAKVLESDRARLNTEKMRNNPTFVYGSLNPNSEFNSKRAQSIKEISKQANVIESAYIDFSSGRASILNKPSNLKEYINSVEARRETEGGRSFFGPGGYVSLKDIGNKPRSGGIKLFLDKMEESVRGLESGNANVTNNSVGVDSRDGNIIDLLRKNRQDRLAAMRDQMLTPASPELPKDVLAGEAVDTDTAWRMRAQQAREETAAGQNFNPEQVPAPRQVIPQNTADPFSAPARPESNEFTQLGRSVGPEYVPDDGMTPDEYVPVQPKKPVKPFNEFIPMPATGNNGEIKVTVNGKEETVRYKRPDISADWRPVTLKDYLEGIIWRNQAIMKEEDTLGLGDGKTAIIGPEQGSARIGSELDFKRTKRRLSSPNNFERPVAPINIGNHRLRAAELLEGLTKEELEQQLPDDVDFPDLFSSLIGARYISEITDSRQNALAKRQQVVQAREAGAHSVGGEIVDIQNTTVNSPKGGQSGTASTQAATGDNNGGGIAAVATVAEPDEVKPTLKHLGDVRNFSDVVAKVKTYNNPIIRFLIGRTQINPSILFNTPVGKAIVAKYRQDLVIEELTNAAVTATLDPFTRAGGIGIGAVRMGADEKGIIKLKSGQKVHWNDVLSDLNTYKPMLNSHQIAYAETFNEVLNDIRTLRDIHGLDNLPVDVNGKLWVPRTVSGVNGLELETPRASNHRLDRIYETATEGVENGITYADPRDTLKLYIYDTYREIVNKQFADEIERVTPGVESLVSKTTIDKYNKWKSIYAEEREKYKVIAEQYANSGTARQRDASLREMMNKQKKRVDRAKAIYNTHQERYNNALTRAKDTKFIGVDNLSTPREVKAFSLSGKSERIVSRKDHKFLSNYIGVTGIVPAQTENVVTKSFNAFGKTIRTATATFDFAAPFTHNLPSLAVNPRGWAKSTAMQYAAYVNPKVKANYIRDNAQIINEMASYGVPVGASEYFEGTARNGPIETVYRKAIKPIPVAGKVVGVAGRQTVGRFESAMETALLVNRVEMWKANREAFMKENHGFLHSGIGVTDNGLDGLAQFVRNVTGGLDSRALMVDKNHRDLESVWLAFSPKLMRSTFALMGMAMKPNTREGRAALRSLAILSGGTVAAFYLLNRAFGNSHEDSVESITPTSGRKFLAVKLDDGYYGVGGQVRAVATFLANSEQVMESGDYSKFTTWNQFDNPILNFYTSRGSPGVSLAQNAIESSTGLNSNPFEEVNGPKGFLLTTSKDFLPFLAQNYIQGKDILGENPEDPESSMKSLIFSANGLRTIPFSRSEERDMTIEAEGYITSDGTQAKTIKDLNDKQRKDFYEKHPVYQIDPVNDNVTKYFTSISEINDQFDKEVLMMAANVNSGKMSKEAFRKWYNDANKNRYSKIDGSKKAFELVPAERYGFKGSVKDYLESRDSRPEDKAVDKYYTLATEVPLKNDGTYDFEEVARRKEAFMKSLSNETRAYVIEMTSSSRRDRLENDVMTEYDIVKKTTKPFFEAENEVFSYMHKNSKFFAQFKDKEAYQAWIDETANGYGITSDTLATVLGSKFPDIKAYNKIESEYKRLMRIKNPELDRSLVEWYGMEPANRLEYTLNNFGLSGGAGLAQAVAADRSLNSTKGDLSLGLNLRREGYKLTNRKFRRPYYSLK